MGFMDDLLPFLMYPMGGFSLVTRGGIYRTYNGNLVSVVALNNKILASATMTRSGLVWYEPSGREWRNAVMPIGGYITEAFGVLWEAVPEELWWYVGAYGLVNLLGWRCFRQATDVLESYRGTGGVGMMLHNGRIALLLHHKLHHDENYSHLCWHANLYVVSDVMQRVSIEDRVKYMHYIVGDALQVAQLLQDGIEASVGRLPDLPSVISQLLPKLGD